MLDKKVRGLKRKTNDMIVRIHGNTREFPTDFYNGYWHLHLPVAERFITSNKTPLKVKRVCLQTLVDQAEQLIRLKPNDKGTYRKKQWIV